jgi:hypothetical protein
VPGQTDHCRPATLHRFRQVSCYVVRYVSRYMKVTWSVYAEPQGNRCGAFADGARRGSTHKRPETPSRGRVGASGLFLLNLTGGGVGLAQNALEDLEGPVLLLVCSVNSLLLGRGIRLEQLAQRSACLIHDPARPPKLAARRQLGGAIDDLSDQRCQVLGTRSSFQMTGFIASWRRADTRRRESSLSHRSMAPRSWLTFWGRLCPTEGHP